MKYDVSEMLREAAASAPDDHTDLGAVLHGGRQRVRRRRRTLAGGVAAVVALTVGVGAWSWSGSEESDQVASTTVPRPEGPVMDLGEAVPGVEGTDYDVLASHTNKDLFAENGQYYDGITEDGLILFRDGPRGPDNVVRTALLDPATGEKDWLPAGPGTHQAWPVELGTDRLVFVGIDGGGLDGDLRADVFDRSSRTWSTLTWSALPGTVDSAFRAEIGPDGRLYVGVPATQGSPPPGGWPTGPDGEADDSGAEGETYDLWSVSLTDEGDARDERLRFGEIAFTDEAMVWTAATNGVNDRIHVRDLATGAEHDFDPRSGKRCNLLGFGVTGDRIVLSQYCGDYDDGRDDRVQVLGTDGELVTTIQGDNVGGGVAGGPDSGLVMITSYDDQREGTYVLELATGRLVRVTDSVSTYDSGGWTPAGYLLWGTAVGEDAIDEDPYGTMDRGATLFAVRWHS